MTGLDRDLTWAALLAAACAGLGLALLALLLSCGARGAERLRLASRLPGRLARRPWLGIVASALLALTAGLEWGATAGIPLPRVHDELSYLLAGDTFAHGRLTNPPVPASQRPFLDTMHVLLAPSYASKYPPAQGLSLAFGRLVFGAEIVGVWLSLALACAAVTWALRQILPPRWALIAGLLVAVHPLVWRWAWIYWGGGLPLLGGALACGGVWASLRRGRTWGGIVAGLGAGLLAASRPYEGVLVLVALTLAPLAALQRGRLAWRRAARLAVTLVVGATPILAGLAYYNARVTGSPLVAPYFVWNKQYGQAPLWLVLEPERPLKTYSNPALAAFHRWELEFWRARHGSSGLAFATREKLRDLWWAALAPFPPLWLALLASLLLLLRAPRFRRTVLPLVLVGLGMLAETWFMPHYVAPALTLAVATLAAATAFVLARSSRRRQLVPLVGVGLLLFVLILPAMQLVCGAARREAGRKPWSQRRAELTRQLEARGGRHLVFVRYGPQHSVHQEWVYNAADLAAAPVLWVHALGRRNNTRLATELAERQAWVLAVAVPEPRLEPLTLTPLQGQGAAEEAEEQPLEAQ